MKRADLLAFSAGKAAVRRFEFFGVHKQGVKGPVHRAAAEPAAQGNGRAGEGLPLQDKLCRRAQGGFRFFQDGKRLFFFRCGEQGNIVFGHHNPQLPAKAHLFGGAQCFQVTACVAGAAAAGAAGAAGGGVGGCGCCG